MKKDYKFSVVMPIYNTEPYLAESVGSIINQTIGFEDNIQLILVNDGSPGNADELCTAYKAQYPENVIYVNQENTGVSHARNNGLFYAAGKYVNFFDSDDIWEADVFQIAYDFLEAHQDEIDAACCIQKYFESVTGFHGLSKKFDDGDRVIDIHENPEHILLNVTSVFIKTEVARHYTFDTEISIGEDSKYITEVIFEKEKYGALKSCVYHIRKRFTGNSLTQAPSPTKFTKTMDRYYSMLPVLSEKKFGRIIPYVQYAMFNGLKFRVLSTRELPLTPEEKEIYIATVISLLKKIDDEVILKAKRALPPLKLYMLKLKYGELAKSDFTIKKNSLYFRSILVANLSLNRLHLKDIFIKDNCCTICGEVKFPLHDDFSLHANLNGVPKEVVLTDAPELDTYSFKGDLIRKGRTICFTFPLDYECVKLTFDITYDGHTFPQKPVATQNAATLRTASLTLGNRCITLQQKELLIRLQK